MNRLLKNHTTPAQRCFCALIHISLFFMLFDWACPIRLSLGFLGPYEGAMILSGISFLVCLIQEKGRFIRRFFHILNASRWLVIVLAAYVLYGLITVFYGPDIAFGSIRYLVVGQMVCYGIMLLYYLFPDGSCEFSLQRLRALALNVGLTGLVIALVAIVGYYTQWYTVYYQRIAPIRDYNQYSTILMMGLVCMTFWLLHARMSIGKRYGLLIPYWMVMASAIYAAGSRRSDVLLCVLAGVLFVYALYCEQKRYKGSGKPRRIAAAFCLLVLCGGLSTGAAYLNFQTVNAMAPVRLEKALKLLETVPEEEIDPGMMESILLAGEQNELSSVLEGLVDGSGFSSRSAIWKAAFEKVRSSDALHLMFGYGASYSWDFYDDLSDPLVMELREHYPMYAEKTQWMNPHNLFLTDALEGGLLLLSLQLLLLLLIGLSLLKLLHRTPHTAVALVLMNLVCYVTLLLSAGRGMVAHKFFWLLIICQIGENYRVQSLAKEVVA